MESNSKTQITCDTCKKAIALPVKGKKAEDKKHEPVPLEVNVEDGMGNPKDYHFCDEECLRMFLNHRKKNAKASLEIDFLNKNTKLFIK